MGNELSRRAFLKIIAITGAAAGGCRSPAARELIPYVIPDENIIPGVPSFYATLCRECPAGCGVVARVREGRVIKLEGNPQDPISAGALCARGHAALQGLYNPDRLATPQERSSSGTVSPITWEAALQAFAERLRAAAAAGADRVAFIGPALGPTLARVVERWLAVWGSRRRLHYEPLSENAARTAADLCFGRRDQPVYQLDGAEVLVSFGADFLETWGSPVELTRQYAAFRAPRLGSSGITMGHAVYVGPRFGLTAANCDEWIGVRPGAEPLVALGILAALVRDHRVAPDLDRLALQRFTNGYEPAAVGQQTGLPAATLQRLARLLGTASGAVVLAGTADPATHVVTALLNAVTGNIGRTVRFLDAAASAPPSQPEEISALLDAMRGGAIDVLVVADANPAFTLPGFSAALSGVPVVVWCGGVPDETAARAHLLLPCHHTLEAWGDAAPRPGVTLLGQPVMQPVFPTLPLGDILLASVHAAGASSDTLPWENTQAAVEATWRELHAQRPEAMSFDAFWQQVREAGGVFTPAPTATVALRPAIFNTPLQLPRQPAGLALAVFPHIFLYDGRGADKPWLQEVPEPVSQIVWNSWAEIHPATAARVGVAEGEVVEIRSAHGRIQTPAHLSEHVQPEVIAVPFGQGHSAYGRYATDRGANPWPLLPLGARAVAVAVRPTGVRRPLVSPLGLPDMLGRPIVEVIRLDDLRRGVTPPAKGLQVTGPYEMHAVHVYPKHQWGMTIDLNACTGCSACVAACYAENNVPVVGEREVARGHIMSWIRIERFVPTGPDAPPLYLMPMLCQQCDHAPCESVCPVYASSHTEEGLNAQVYNRCIGTRYCNNNCPYKVRRFNWFQPQWPAPSHLRLNPDVTARSAGVMEKCTFCIQRIRAAEMDAAAEHRAVADGEIIPACAQACPAQAITFGDMKAANSAMMQRRAAHPLRTYRALEDLNTQPAIVYLREIFRRPEAA
jgi:anaerobic selenocysteine-containing dehydrogenase/Fe-S-cluster-containing dehydrogenase component